MAKKKKKETEVKENLPDQKWMSEKIKKTMKAMDKGLTPAEAYFLVTGKRHMHPNTKVDLRKKHDKWRLSRPQLQKLAHDAVKDTLKMKPTVTDEVKTCPECRGKKDEDGSPAPCVTCGSKGVVKTLLYPTVTNRLAAAAMVTDRTDPVIKKTMNLNANVSFIGEAKDLDIEAFQDC